MKRLIRVTALHCLISSLGFVSQASAWTGKMDLISPSNCQTKNDRLVLCGVPTTALTGTVSETAVPLRTVVSVTKNGDCTTPYSLNVLLGITGEPVVKFTYLRDATLTLRRRDGAPINKLVVQDVPPWTGRISVPTSCRIGLNVTANEPDVYSKEEAQALLDKLEQDLQRKR